MFTPHCRLSASGDDTCTIDDDSAQFRQIVTGQWFTPFRAASCK